jgi:hypothetical protein
VVFAPGAFCHRRSVTVDTAADPRSFALKFGGSRNDASARPPDST